jgi:hypothetical protein
MEEQRSDELTQFVGREAGTRRPLLRDLAGSVHTVLAACLGGDEVADAKLAPSSSPARRRMPDGVQSVGTESFCDRRNGMCRGVGCAA